MTPVETVRARLAEVKALCEGAWADRRSPLVRTDSMWEGDYGFPGADAESLLIACMSPDQVLRLVAHAEDVLDRHRPSKKHPGCYEDGAPWPCPEVAGIIKAWTP